MAELLFSNSNNRIREFFKNGNLELSPELEKSILKFLSRACTYEEEEKKIKPMLLIGRDIEENSFGKIYQSEVISLINEEITDTNFDKRIKQLMPFCSEEWIAYINFHTDKLISYGIIKSFNGPFGVSTKEALTTINENCGIDYILIDVKNCFELQLVSSSTQKLSLDFRIHTEEKNDEDVFKKIIEDIYTDEIKNNKIDRLLNRILNLIKQKVHGTICLVIKKECILPSENLNDGIFLEKPIELIKMIKEIIDYQENIDINYGISAYEKLNNLINLFIEMLNFDGITIIDNEGRIRGYNIFVQPDLRNSKKTFGGARKRAAQSLLDNSKEEYIGVYFQSQDGHVNYERIDNG